MIMTIKAHYRQGWIEPDEPLPLRDGAEIELTVSVASPPEKTPDPIAGTAGAWAGLLDCDEFEEEVYQSRLLRTRPDVAL